VLLNKEADKPVSYSVPDVRDML